MNRNTNIILPIHLIGISGKSQSGKDTVGKIIQFLVSFGGNVDSSIFDKWNLAPSQLERFSNWQIKKFATKVKEVCSLLTGIPVEDFEKEEVKSSYLGEECSKFYYSIKLSDGCIINGPYNKSEEDCKEYALNYKYNTQTIIECNKIIDHITVRELLQKVGTDAMRDIIHPDVWVNALMKDYRPVPSSKNRDYLSINGKMEDVGMAYDIKEYPNWIITDVRFPNEAKAIKDRQGIVIRVNRVRYLWTGDSYNWEEFSKVVFKDTGEYPDKKYADTHYKTTTFSHISETALDDYSFDYVIENDSDIPSLVEKVKEMLIHFKLL